jgi:hypothetical protein
MVLGNKVSSITPEQARGVAERHDHPLPHFFRDQMLNGGQPGRERPENVRASLDNGPSWHGTGPFLKPVSTVRASGEQPAAPGRATREDHRLPEGAFRHEK